MSASRRRKLYLTTLLVPVVFLLAFSVGGMAWFHFGSPAATCASCHEMAGRHAEWSASSHRTLHCRNCHGGSLTLDIHALRAHVNRVVQHFRPTQGKPPGLTEKERLALHQACRNCHPQSFGEWQGSRHSATYARIFLDATHNQTEQLAPDCLRCHGMFFDGHIEDLVTPVATTGPWSLKNPAMASQPVIPCLACHQIHSPSAGIRAAHLYVRREHTSLADDLLPVTPMFRGEQAVTVSSDPRQRLCIQCHAPNAFRQLGSADDRTPTGVHEGLSCLDCHDPHSNSAKASCAACHPAFSHCGINVEQMDTSFRASGSKHNIHTVACGDCHNGHRPAAR
jgi:hypothetical protein